MKKNMLILSGWASQNLLFKDLIKLLEKHYHITFLDFNHILDMDKLEHLPINHIKNKKDVHIIAWSLGSLVAIKLMALYPDNIKKATLIGGFCKFCSTKDYKDGINKSLIKTMKKELNQDTYNQLYLFYKNLFSKKESRFFQYFISNINISHLNKVSLINGLNYLIKTDYIKEISTIKIPITLIHGTDDLICPIETSQFLNNKLSNSVLYPMKNTGHVPFYVDPKGIYKIIKEEDYYD